MAVISKDIKLYFSLSGETEFTELFNLQEIPDLGGEVEAIEITTLSDAAHIYTDGLKNYGDSLAFKFLYDKEQFTLLNNLNVTGDTTSSATSPRWKVELPDGSLCIFSGGCSVKLDGVGINSAITYTLSIKPNSEMKWS